MVRLLDAATEAHAAGLDHAAYAHFAACNATTSSSVQAGANNSVFDPQTEEFGSIGATLGHVAAKKTVRPDEYAALQRCLMTYGRRGGELYRSLRGNVRGETAIREGVDSAAGGKLLGSSWRLSVGRATIEASDEGGDWD